MVWVDASSRVAIAMRFEGPEVGGRETLLARHYHTEHLFAIQ